MDKHPRIEIDPAVMEGKPVIRGTRITVEHILRHLGDYATLADFVLDFPSVTEDDVRAALAYAADQLHQPAPSKAAYSAHPG